MPCFEPVLTIAAGVPWSIIAWAKLWTPLMTDAQYPLPALVMVKRAAARRDAGIVHQHPDLAERGIGAVLQPLHILRSADVGRHRDNRRSGQLVCGSVERLSAHIGQANFHDHRREPLCRG